MRIDVELLEQFDHTLGDSTRSREIRKLMKNRIKKFNKDGKS